MAEQKTQQTMRYSDEELSLIKNTFAEQDDLLRIIRKVFLQGDLTSNELKIIRTFTISPEAVKILRKTLKPEIDLDAPFFQITDLYVNIDTKESMMEKVYPLIVARDLVCDYLEQQFAQLEGTKYGGEKIDLRSLAGAKGKDPHDAFVQLCARNTILNHIDFQLNQLKILAGMKEESVEQTKARLAKNSNK